MELERLITLSEMYLGNSKPEFSNSRVKKTFLRHIKQYLISKCEIYDENLRKIVRNPKSAIEFYGQELNKEQIEKVISEIEDISDKVNKGMEKNRFRNKFVQGYIGDYTCALYMAIELLSKD